MTPLPLVPRRSLVIKYITSLVVTGCCLTGSAQEARRGDTSSSPVLQETIRAIGSEVDDLVALSTGGSQGSARARATTDAVAEARALAARLRNAAAVRGEPATVREANRLEARVLLHSAMLGDDRDSVRRRELISTLRAEKAIAPELRCELVGLEENLELLRSPGRSITAIWDRQLEIAHALAREFPEVEACYESLLAMAEVRRTDEARTLAESVQSAPGASPRMRLEASSLLERLDLVGRSLSDVLGDVPPEFPPGTWLVIYTWSSRAPQSLSLARRIAGQVPAGTALVGLQLDPEAADSAAQIEREQPPGAQIHGFSGDGGVVRWRLRLGTPGRAYLVDPDGRIVSVTAHHRIAAGLPMEVVR